MSKIDETTDEIRELFENHGKDLYYGEACSQYNHAAQACSLAEIRGYDLETQVAAFLHDIGHLLDVPNIKSEIGNYVRHAHESIAQTWLMHRGFSTRISMMVANHVKAKRYLCTTDAGYLNTLSDASATTLVYQGGLMDAQEKRVFEDDEYFEDSIRLRLLDEESKTTGLDLPGIDHYLNKCIQHLSSQATQISI